MRRSSITTHWSDNRYAGSIAPVKAGTDDIQRNCVAVGDTHTFLHFFSRSRAKNSRNLLCCFKGGCFRGPKSNGIGDDKLSPEDFRPL